MSALLAQEIEKRAHPEIRLIADAGVASLRLSSYRMLLSLRDLSTAELQNQNTVQAHLLAAAGGAGLKPEQNSYKELFTRLANRGSLAGVESLRGKAVRKDIASTMTFDLINPRVLEFINRYTLSLITLISADTRTAIQAILYNAVRSGMPPREQARLIRPLIGLTTNQVSAVTRYRAALEAGQYRQTLNNVLRDKRYDASTLRALRNKEALSRAQIEKMVARYAERQLKHRAEMIARTECLTGDTFVDAAVVRAAFRRPYSGDICHIETRSGRKLSATPNHPVLTRRGWMFMHELKSGDYLICDTGQNHSGPSGNVNKNSGPSTISEIFSSLEVVGISERYRASNYDFHGDGMQSDVDVCSSLWSLNVGNFSPLFEPLTKCIFSEANESRSAHCSFCRRLLSVDKQPCLCSGSQLHMAIFQDSLDSIAINRELIGNFTQGDSGSVQITNAIRRQIGSQIGRATAGCIEQFASFACSSADSVSLDDQSNLILGESGSGSNFTNAHRRQVEFDEVILVGCRQWSGHVFNLSTPYGYFNVSGGIYTGNTIRAANAGQVESWLQAQEQGLTGTMRERWLVASDERLCPNCQSIPGMNPDGVAIGEMFATPYGPIMHPPAHPMCRCSLGIR